MRRVVLAVVAAAFGAGAVIGLAPRSGGPHIIASGNTVPTTPSSSAAASPSASPSRSKHRTWPAKSHASSSSTPTSSAPKSSASRATQSPTQTDRTITGPEVSNGWGPIQVTVTLKGTTITAVDVPVTPQDGRSQFINSRAVPILTQEAVQAQSAQVDAVSGATDTSDAFMQSLAAALKQTG
jgi:uncharacterized protein with FMN-binding domain